MDTKTQTPLQSLPGLGLGCLCLFVGFFSSSAWWRLSAGPASRGALLPEPGHAGGDAPGSSRQALQQYVATPEDLELLGATSRMTVTVPPWLFARPQALAVADGEPQPPSPEDAALMTAQDYEDNYAHAHFFAGRRNGLILESGALDGVQFSVSNFFVRARGWRAVHVEGSPHSFQALARNRPEALNINAAICSRLTPLHYASRSEGANGGAAGGFWDFMSQNMCAALGRPPPPLCVSSAAAPHAHRASRPCHALPSPPPPPGPGPGKMPTGLALTLHPFLWCPAAPSLPCWRSLASRTLICGSWIWRGQSWRR